LNENFSFFRNKLGRRSVNLIGPSIAGNYVEHDDDFAQILSDRRYTCFAYIYFEGFNFFRLTNCRNTDSWRTFSRLYSYSSHVLAYHIPLLNNIFFTLFKQEWDAFECIYVGHSKSIRTDFILKQEEVLVH